MIDDSSADGLREKAHFKLSWTHKAGNRCGEGSECSVVEGRWPKIDCEPLPRTTMATWRWLQTRTSSVQVKPCYYCKGRLKATKYSHDSLWNTKRKLAQTKWLDKEMRFECHAGAFIRLFSSYAFLRPSDALISASSSAFPGPTSMQECPLSPPYAKMLVLGVGRWSSASSHGSWLVRQVWP